MGIFPAPVAVAILAFPPIKDVINPFVLAKATVPVAVMGSGVQVIPSPAAMLVTVPAPPPPPPELFKTPKDCID
jgi:hypothetical protein